MASSETATAQPPLSRMIRKTLMCPTFCATFNPVAMVRPGALGSMSAACDSIGADDRRAGHALDADHPGPLGPDQAECLELVERLGHADDAGSSAGRVDDHVGKLPAPVGQAVAGRFGHLEPQRLLPFGAPPRLLKCGDTEVALRDIMLTNAFPTIDDRPGDEVELDVVGIKLSIRSHFAQDGQVGVG